MRGYALDRTRDCGDIVTASVGSGGGLKLRASVLNLGYIAAQEDVAGLRCGEVKFGLQKGESVDEAWGYEDTGEGVDLFHGLNREYPQKQRGKGYVALRRFPGIMVPQICWESQTAYHYYTQVELVMGLGCSLRMGVNLGELLDFVLGFTGIDIFRDDRDAMEARLARTSLADSAVR